MTLVSRRRITHYRYRGAVRCGRIRSLAQTDAHQIPRGKSARHAHNANLKFFRSFNASRNSCLLSSLNELYCKAASVKGYVPRSEASTSSGASNLASAGPKPQALKFSAVLFGPSPHNVKREGLSSLTLRSIVTASSSKLLRRITTLFSEPAAAIPGARTLAPSARRLF